MSDIASPPTDTLGPKMAACSERERKFVWAYLLNGGNQRQAAIAAGFSNASGACDVRGHELMQRDRVLEAMHEVSWKTMRGLSLVAVLQTERILKEGTDADRLKAAFGVLNRTGFGEATVVQHNHTGSIELNHTDAALEALTYMRSLNVPRETLEQQFGKSGLSRYERMLEERNSRVKTIEGKVE